MRKALELIETVEDKREILETIQIQNDDEKSLLFFNRFKDCLEIKFK